MTIATDIEHRGHYGITASITRTLPDGWTSSVELPTFYLDYRVQGIVSAAHAERIARRMLTDAAGPDAELHVSAYPVEGDNY